MIGEAHTAQDLGRLLRLLRRRRGWTQAQLGEWLSVTRQTVIAMEKGGPVSMPVAMRAMALLGGKAVIVEKGAAPPETGPAPMPAEGRHRRPDG
jgi:DNA-binding XRE family transcriptional regulator